MVEEQAGILDARPSSAPERDDRSRESTRRERYAEPKLGALR